MVKKLNDLDNFNKNGPKKDSSAILDIDILVCINFRKYTYYLSLE
jgi:hypothetical protein